jgi:hypothetical protein
MKGFKYDKFKEELSSGDSWGSYSDLFMVLSFVFLMMYVVANLRSGTNSIAQRLEKQKIAKENADLKAQMKAYNTLKEQALKDESEQEQQVYQQLMDKLSLLQEEAKSEKDKLRRQARENEQKETALNQYQQIVRNIINANLLAKHKLKVREEIIDKKNVVIGNLNEDIEQKKGELARNTAEIEKINTDLAQNIAKLEKAQHTSKITREKAYREIALLKKKSHEQIEKLNQENTQVQEELNKINHELSKTSTALVETQSKNEQLNQKLDQTVTQYEDQISKLQQGHQEKMARERTALEKKLKSAKMTAVQKAKELAAFNKTAQDQAKTLSQQIANLKGDLNEARSRAEANELAKQKLAADMAREKADFESKLQHANLTAQEKARQLAEFNQKAREKTESLNREIAGLKDNLAEAEARANARMKLAKEIATALKSAGVDANVNGQTGDVTISFGQDYFDSGSAELKPSMAQVLQKFIPKYSESLFKDAKISEKITSIDIIGFASPTYQNRYVDPQSLDPKDKAAVKYNLDLSYKRASSIFDYMFDTKKIQYKNQKKLLSLVKVTGRSFFAQDRAPAGVTPGMGQREFCLKFDCKQAQKVIIKFNMDDKK